MCYFRLFTGTSATYMKRSRYSVLVYHKLVLLGTVRTPMSPALWTRFLDQRFQDKAKWKPTPSIWNFSIQPNFTNVQDISIGNFTFLEYSLSRMNDFQFFQIFRKQIVSTKSINQNNVVYFIIPIGTTISELLQIKTIVGFGKLNWVRFWFSFFFSLP